MLTHTGTQKIETKRLILRRLKISDSKDMFENYASDPENVKYLSREAHKNIQETENFLSECISNYKKMTTISGQ